VTRRPRATAAVLLAIALLFGVACSDDDDGVVPDLSATTSPATTRTTAAPTTSTDDGLDGADGVDDPYFPTLGNGGYDVVRYDIDLTVSEELIAGVTIEATATEALDTFHLDFGNARQERPFEIETVEVDGTSAAYDHVGEELVVDPAEVLAEGHEFVVVVRYHGTPAPVPDDLLGTLGWQQVAGVTFVSDEPGGTHSWMPVNDHPSDKAAYRVSITVPDGTTAVASGMLASRESNEGWTTWVWDHPDPIPSYVLALAVGPLTLVESDGPHGIHIRHAFPSSLVDRGTAAFAATSQMITDLEALFGPYPFDTYGALVVEGELGYAMENQTLALFPASILDGTRSSTLTLVHELSHHWFGNWVTPATWNETWLNEGLATYAEELWLEYTTPGYDIDGAMRSLASRPLDPIGDPGPDEMFGAAVYQRGALTLHALRLAMGDAGFFQLLRAWPDRFGGRTASTDDLADLASEIAGQDLRLLVDAWVNDAVMPPLPA
jgi:aminopeptidase N